MILKFIQFLHQIFGISTDATANILVTIFTFSLGIFITVCFKAIEGYLKRRNNRNLLRINLIILIKGIYKQITGYERMASQLNIEHNGSFNFTTTAIVAVDIFKELGYKQLHAAVFSGIENIRFRNRRKKRVAFNNVWSTIGFLSTFHQSSFKLTNEFFELNIEANRKRNFCLGEANKIVENIRLTLNNLPIPIILGKYFQSLERILLNVQSVENYTNPKKMNDLYVQPMLELNRNSLEAISKFSGLIRPVDLNAFLLECQSHYENQKNLIEGYHYNFKNLETSFLEQYNKMKSAYRILR